MPSLPYLLVCAFGFSLALVLAGIVGAAAYILSLEHRVRRLESSQPFHNAVVDTTEEFTPKFLEVQRQYQVMGAHLDNLAMKVAYMRNVGDPNASWKEIVKWHNEKYPTKPKG